MKLLKGIIKAVFILIFVLVVAVVVFLLVISDNSTPNYKPSEDLTTLDGLLGKGIYESLDKIALIQKEDRPTSENNKIDFSFTYQNINDCVTDIIRTNESINNPTYLMTDGTDKILQNGVVSFPCGFVLCLSRDPASVPQGESEDWAPASQKRPEFEES